MNDEDETTYARSDSVESPLQRGRGLGAPAGPLPSLIDVGRTR
ncbi:hypothetical protein ACWDUX_02130 [Streptomyces sp. NPDC003444]